MPSEKRSRDDTTGYPSDSSVKRPRRDHEDSQRDWRSVHLQKTKNGSSSRKPDGYRDRERDRRDDYRSSSSYRSSRRDEPGFGSSGDGHRLDKDKHIVKGESSRGHDGHRSTKSQVPFNDEEREEGEISPQPTVLSKHSPKQDTPAQAAIEQPSNEEELIFEEEKPKVDDAAARRARRAAILAQYQQESTPSTPNGLTPAVPQQVSSLRSSVGLDTTSTPPPTTPYRPETETAAVATPKSPTGADFQLSKPEDDVSILVDEENLAKDVQRDGGVEGVDAADYDPSKDRKDDDVRHAVKLNGDQYAQDIDEEEEGGEESDEEDLDDMFALLDEEKPKKPKKKKSGTKKPKVAVGEVPVDAADDEEGYYHINLGEILDGGRYQVFAILGKGMFSNVVRARVLEQGENEGKEVAIKLVRSQESMYKAGLKEVQILQKLRQGDPEDKKHLVRLERTFEHRGHLCLVFESLSMNLREVVKRFGRDVGLNIKAVRAYAHQLFLALSHLRKCNILHADIKPDNILVNDSKSLLKLCDLGSATDTSVENTATMITPYLVSRFYRAPEIILGIPYDTPVDVWSVGCTLYELFTGKILFPGKSNRDMLRLMMECKGRFNTKILRKAKFMDDYFDDMGIFLDVVEGAAGTGDMMRKLNITKPSRDIRSRLMPKGTTSSGNSDGNSSNDKLVLSFIDLLEKCLALDPARRITPKDALNHPFVRG